MNKLLYLITASGFIGFLSACSPIDSVRPFDQQQANVLLHEDHRTQPAKQMITLRLPNGQHWQKTGNPVMLFPYEENASNWHQRIDTKISGYKNTPGITASTFVKNEIDIAAQNCKHIRPEILEETSAALIYRLNAAGCVHDEDSKQIAKVFNGMDAVYLVRYSAIEGKTTPVQFDHMSRSIKTAQLIKNPGLNQL